MKKTITSLICCFALGVPATLQSAPKSKTSAGVFSEKFTKVEKNMDIRLQAETAQQNSDGGYISILNDYQYARRGIPCTVADFLEKLFFGVFLSLLYAYTLKQQDSVMGINGRKTLEPLKSIRVRDAAIFAVSFL